MSFWRFRTHRIPRMRDDLSYCPTSCPMTRSVFLKGPLATLALSVASSWKRRASLSQALQWRILSSTHLQTLLLEQLWTVTFFKSFFFFFFVMSVSKRNIYSEVMKSFLWGKKVMYLSPPTLTCFSFSFQPPLCVDRCWPLCPDLPGVQLKPDPLSDTGVFAAEAGCGNVE